MKKIFLLFFFVPIFIISANAAGYDIEEKLANLERSAFSQVYSNDDLSSRLTRLETEYFGAKQSGTLDNRLDKLMKNIYFCDTPPLENFSYTLYQTPETISSSKGLKGIWNKIKNDFEMGTITGYTPPLGNSYYDNLYGGSNNSIYSPFSSPFYQNKFRRHIENFRNDNINGSGFNYKRRINPFVPRTLGVSDRPYSSVYKPNQPYHTRFYNPNSPYNQYKPSNYNAKTTIGTRVTLID